MKGYYISLFYKKKCISIKKTHFEAHLYSSTVRTDGVMNSKLQLKQNYSSECVFMEEMLENYYNLYSSCSYGTLKKPWYIALRKTGRPRKGMHQIFAFICSIENPYFCCYFIDIVICHVILLMFYQLYTLRLPPLLFSLPFCGS